MKHLRRVLSSRPVLFAAALAVCLAPRPLSAQIGPAAPGNNYYPRTDAPVNDNDALELIESMLHDQSRKVKNGVVSGQTVFIIKVPSLYMPDSTGTPVLPPLPGDDNKNDYPTSADHYILASDAELETAVGGAVQKVLDGTAAKSSFPSITTTDGSAHVMLSSTKGLSVGEVISGPGIPAGATIAAIHGNTVVLSAAVGTGGSGTVEVSRTIGSVISSISNYRVKSIKKVLKAAVTNILNYQGGFSSATVGGSQEAAIAALTAAACDADPASAAGVVQTILPLVVPKVKGSVPASPVLLGSTQTARTPDTTLTTATLSAALNSIAEIAKKGGVTVTEENPTQLRITFGSDHAIVDKTPANAGALQTALNEVGLDHYGQFTVVADNNPVKQPVVAFQNDYVISYRPINLNRAGGTTFNSTPGFGNVVDEVMTAAMQKASANAVAIVTAALGSVMQGVDVSTAQTPTANGTLATARGHAQEVAAIAIKVAYAEGRGYLGDEIAVAVGTKVKAASYVHAGSAPGVKKPIAMSHEIASAIFSYPGAPTALKEVGLIAAGLMKGFKGSIFEGGTTGTFADPDLPEANIVAQIKSTLALDASGQTYMDNVQGGFVNAYSASSPTSAPVVGAAIVAGITGGNINNLAARLTGGLAWLPAAVTAKGGGFTSGSFIADVLQKDATLNGTAAIADIIEIATRSNATQAANIANLAATWSQTTSTLETERLGRIIRGTALGLKGQPLYNTLLASSVGKIITAAPIAKVPHKITNVDDSGSEAKLKSAVSLTEFNATGRQQIRELTSYALTGAKDAGHTNAAASIAYTLAKATSAFYQFYQPILEGAIDAGAGGTGAAGAGTLAASEQWRAVLAVMAPKKLSTLEFDGTYDESITAEHPKPTANFKTLHQLIPVYAATVPDYSALNNQPIAKGGAVIRNIQDFPKAVFSKAFDGFVDSAVQADLTMTKAVLTGVALMSPKDAPLAGVLGVKFRPQDSEAFKAEAIGLNPAMTTNVTIAVDTAKHVASGTSDLFDYLNGSILKYSKNLADIVTGATVVAPGYAHIVGHAVAFSSPSNVSKVVPQIFNYSSITETDPLVSAPQRAEYDNRVDAAAAVSAAITAGIVEAKTGHVSGNASATKQTIETANLKNAISAMVKQVLSVTGNTPVLSQYLAGTNIALSSGATGHDSAVGGGEGANNFLQSDGSEPEFTQVGAPGGDDIITGGFTKQKQVGPAGIITGFMSQVMKSGDTTLPARGHSVTSATGDAIGMIGQILAAAVVVVQSDPSKILAVAQAAAQAARAVAGSSFGATGQEAIVDAILFALDKKVNGSPTPITSASHPFNSNSDTLANGKDNPLFEIHIKVANAVAFGVLAAANNYPGAGAAGVINYTHNNLSGQPVTDIFGL